MYTDVLFESAHCGEKAFRLLEKKGIVDNIRYFISPARPSGLDREHFVLLLPYVMRAGNESRIKAMTEREEPLRIMVRNIEELGYLNTLDSIPHIISDSCLYSFNGLSRETLKKLNVSEDTLPLELNFNELNRRGCRGSVMVIYGRIPMMVSAQCTHKTASGSCRKAEEGFFNHITDRKGVRFPVRAECGCCYNVIYNSVPLSLFKEIRDIKKLEPSALRLDFTTESPEEAALIIEGFFENGLREDGEKLIPAYTKGHFRKGVI